MQNEQNTYRNTNNDDQSIDIKNLIYICLSHWYLFVAGAVIALAIGFVINRYTTNVYQVTGTVLVKEDKTSFDPTSIMTGISYGSMQKNNIKLSKNIQQI